MGSGGDPAGGRGEEEEGVGLGKFSGRGGGGVGWGVGGKKRGMGKVGDVRRRARIGATWRGPHGMIACSPERADVGGWGHCPVGRGEGACFAW